MGSFIKAWETIKNSVIWPEKRKKSWVQNYNNDLTLEENQDYSYLSVLRVMNRRFPGQYEREVQEVTKRLERYRFSVVEGGKK